MHLYEKRPVFPWKGIVITILVFVVVIGGFTAWMGRTGRSADREQISLLENALRSAAVTHYAVEGNYPATVGQIVKEYGVIIDEERFIVRYDVFANNIMPSISVILKGEGAS